MKVLFNQLTKAFRGFTAAELSSGDVESDRLPIFGVGRGCRAVDFQKDKASAKSCSLIPVDERMICAQIEKIGGSNFNQVCKRRLASEGGLRGCYTGIEEFLRPYSGASPEFFDRREVNFNACILVLQSV